MCKRCNNLEYETILIFENKRSMGAEGKMDNSDIISKICSDESIYSKKEQSNI